MTVTLRPMKPDDGPALVEIFRASVEEIGAEDHDAAQVEAWASAADDPEAFAARLSSMLTLLAFLDGEMAGFASLKGSDVLEMLYVHPVFAERGVATALVDALERLAAARGAKRMTVEASDTALPAFQSWGYRAERRNTVMRAGVFIANTTMTKDLPPPAGASEERH